MGVDIWIHFEYKNHDDEWINCDKFRINPVIESEEEFNTKEEKYFLSTVPYFRDSVAFGLLAGVRSLEQPIREKRGLPDDMHWLTAKIAAEQAEWTHSHTYYTLDELLKWRKQSKKKWKKAVRENAAAFGIDNQGGIDYIDTGSEIIECKYKRLDIIIKEAKKALEENLYCYTKEDIECNADRFRIILWFDS